MINRPVEKLRLLECNDELPDRICASLHIAKVHEMEEPTNFQRGKMPPQVAEVNDCSSSVGEEIEADK